jgi:hypothetical protein
LVLWSNTYACLVNTCASAVLVQAGRVNLAELLCIAHGFANLMGRLFDPTQMSLMNSNSAWDGFSVALLAREHAKACCANSASARQCFRDVAGKEEAVGGSQTRWSVHLDDAAQKDLVGTTAQKEWALKMVNAGVGLCLALWLKL